MIVGAVPRSLNERSSWRRLRLRHDVVGAVLVVLLATWMIAASVDDGGDLISRLTLLGGVSGMYVIARLVPRGAKWAVAVSVLLGITVTFAPHLDEVVARIPLAQPLGYANANAALLFQAAIAGVLVAALVGVAIVRVAAIALAVGAVVLASTSGSEAVIVLVALTPVAVLGVTLGLARHLPVVLATVLVAAVAATSMLGATFRLAPEVSATQALAERVFSERRLELWRDAFVLMRDHPVTGVGPGRFSVTSPTALADADASWAHQEFLQIGAEAGGPAMVLLLALFVWALFRLRSDRRLSAAAGIAAFGIAALGLHASVDYVLHFWQVPVAAAALAGVAVDRRRHAA